MKVLAGLPLSQASQLPQLIFSGANFLGRARSLWELGLPVRVVGQSMMVLAGLPLSQASQLPQLVFSGANFLGPARAMWEPGLPAMAVCQSMEVLADPPLSQASQLPQLIFSGANFFGTIQITVGAGLARDGGGSVDEGVGWATAFAGKPAPTVDLQWGEFFRHDPNHCGSRACL
ncbi:hypothetical protein BBG20_01390 [Pseudomonas aylmerensis]|uniref:Uncharacterized protein n=1 Tax=Pseudomonas aylmerensis TaxID=1869229 RepID=A0ABX2Z224_9PSED|nr:hypothetical protein BBG20_01390 [Pseudomonas aylmerensis]